MPRRLALAVLMTLVVVGSALAGPARAASATAATPAHVLQPGPADDPDGDPATDDAPAAEGDGIIPRPNSGHEPSEAGDRGGALQVAVFLLIVVGLGTMLALAVRESRRSRARQAAARAGGQPSGA